MDESVFALAEQDPEFERLYFLLEKELLTPKYDIHGFSLPELILEKPAAEQALEQAYQAVSFAALADATPQEGLFSLKTSARARAERLGGDSEPLAAEERVDEIGEDEQRDDQPERVGGRQRHQTFSITYRNPKQNARQTAAMPSAARSYINEPPTSGEPCAGTTRRRPAG